MTAACRICTMALSKASTGSEKIAQLVREIDGVHNTTVPAKTIAANFEELVG